MKEFGVKVLWCCTLVLFFILFQFTSVCGQEMWKNPITVNNEWSQYGMGDPYIFKYKGIFYLHISTKNREIGTKCWSSRDLVDWKYEGIITTDSTTLGAYAPEVMYWNGKFYMYSSPRGRGHYVYESDSPTGPFERITENIGKSIDGSVLIDDDGQWYFYHAGDKGIEAAPMSSPFDFGESSNTGAWMNNEWTEGPSVIKRNGIYHMIYTGNHIHSRGYRIDYASSQSSPISNFKPHSNQNPIILATEDDAFKGLGHGTIFIGPDLSSYYITYHNHISRRGPVRQWNFDRVAWNGDKLNVLGPTNFKQQAPKLPDAFDYFDRDMTGDDWEFPAGDKWHIVDNDYLTTDWEGIKLNKYELAILSSKSEDNFTAEFNFKETERFSSDATLGAIINYVDKENFGIVVVNNDSRKLEINFVDNGQWSKPIWVDIKPDLDFTQWQTMTIEKIGSDYKIFIHDLLIHEFSKEISKGKIGYFTNRCRAAFGFIALSNHVQGSAIFDVYKPIPGSFDAIFYNSGGESVTYICEKQGVAKRYTRKDEVNKVECTLGGYGVANMKKGESLTYNVNVESTREFNVQIIYAALDPDGQVKLFLDGEDISGVVEFPRIVGGKWGSLIISGLQLTKGYHVLKIGAVGGKFDFYALKFEKSNNAPIQLTKNFNSGVDTNWIYIDGEWGVIDGTLRVEGSGKQISGNYEWSDYTVETDIKYVKGADAGVIFRVRNPSQGKAGNSPEAGVNFFQGYYVSIGNNKVNLSKHNYNTLQLASSKINIKPEVWHHLRIEVFGNKISVFVDNQENAVLVYEDRFPFMGGGVGFRANETIALFDNFIVK